MPTCSKCYGNHFDSECVVYTGPNLPCTGVDKNDTLEEALVKIDAAICDSCCGDGGGGGNGDGFFTEDTYSVDLEGEGTEGTPLTANVIISPDVDNQAEIRANGLYVGPTPVYDNAIIYGGIVTWLQDYDYHISPAGYYINGVFYESPEAYVTLDPADPTFDRIDTFILTTGEIATVNTGIPSPAPTEPPLDILTQIRISAAYVGAGTTEPGILVECIYKENVEWTTTASDITIDPISINSPNAGTVSIEASSTVDDDNIIFVRASSTDIFSDFTIVTFRLKAKVSWTNVSSLKLTWLNGATPYGNIITVQHGQFGFDATSISNYQIISIPLNLFGIPGVTLIDTFKITVNTSVTWPGWFIDDICLQDIEVPTSALNINFGDTTTVDFSYNSITNTYTADVNVSQDPTNTITILPDGIFSPSNIDDGLAYGGIVTWLGDYDYHISPAGYFINGVFYESPEAFVTLDPSDVTFDRIDTFIVDNTETASALTGTPSANPVEPPLDLATQLRLSAALVGANTTEPPIAQECIYLEDAEWTTNPSTVAIIPNSPNNPSTGTIDVEGTSIPDGVYIDFVRSSAENIQDLFTTLTLRIRAKTGWLSTSTLKLRWYNGVSSVGNILTLGSGDYGFDRTNDTTYQYIAIPLGDFGSFAGIPVDTLRIEIDTVATLPGFYLDNVCMQMIELPPTAAVLTFQNGTRKTGNVVEFGSPSQYSGPGWLLHNTWLNTSYYQFNVSGHPVYTYVFNVDQVQNFENSTGIQSWHSSGATPNTQPDYLNAVKLGINYTSNVYEATGPDLDGYFGPEDIGYYLSTNITGHGSFGQYTDDIDSKINGIFFHTLDTASHSKALTFFGDDPAGVLAYTGMAASKIMSLYNNKDIQLYGYPNTRDDGATATVLYTDIDGIVKHGPIDVEGASIVITADNALTKDTPTNVQLGGPLIHNTDIELSEFKLTISNGTFPFLLADNSTNDFLVIGDVNGAIPLTSGGALFLSKTPSAQLTSARNLFTPVDLILESVGETALLGVQGGTNLTIDNISSLTTLTDEFRLLDYGAGTYVNAASYWLGVDGNGFVVELAPPLAGITADNAITASSATNVQLGFTNNTGSPLLHETYINTDAFSLRINTTEASINPLKVDAVNGFGIWSNSVGGFAIYGNSTNTHGVVGQADAAFAAGVYGQSVDGFGGYFMRNPLSTNTIVPIVTVQRQTQGTAANNIGGSIDFNLQLDTAAAEISNQLISKWTTAAELTRVSQFIVTGVNNAVTSDLLTLSGNGGLRMNKYGVGSFTTGTATYLIATDASGNWFEYPSGGVGAGLITADNGLTVSAPNNVQLGGALLHSTTVDGGASYTTIFTGSGTQRSLEASSTGGGLGARIYTQNATGNTAISALEVGRYTSVAAANGIGVSLDLSARASDGNLNVGNKIISRHTDVTFATLTSNLELWGANSGTVAQKAVLTGAGVLGLGKYSSLTGTRLEVVDDALAGASMAKFTSASTAATGTNLHKVVEIIASGANATTTQTTYGLHVTNTHTGLFSQSYAVYGFGEGGSVQAAGVYGQSTTGIGTLGVSTSWNGVRGESTSHYGVNGISSSGIGVYASAITGVGLIADINPSTTNTDAEIAQFRRLTTGTPAAGIGGYVSFHVETTASINEMGRMGYTVTDVGSGTEDADFVLYIKTAGSIQEKLKISSSNIFTITQGLGNYVDDAAASAGGVPVNGLYRNGSIVMIRVA